MVLCAFLWPAVSFSAGMSNSEPIATLHFYEDHADAFLFSQPNMLNPGNECAQPTPAWYALQKSHPHFDEIYSLILMAKATGANVLFRLSGCYSGAYPKVKDVYL